MTHLWVKKGSADEALRLRVVYGESYATPEAANLRGRACLVFDGAGLAESASYDFKGNALTMSRRLAVTYTDEPDWTPVSGGGTPSALLAQAASLLETETFSNTFAYDALSRVTSATLPDLSELRPTYNEAGLLEAVDARIRGAASWTAFVTGIAYDEKGRRQRIDYGNGTFTEYFYDPLSFRLTRLRTQRTSDNAKLQDLFYFYDPVGNITTIRDDTQEDVFFAGQQVLPTQDFVYDAIYRLVWAKGREHAGGTGDNQRDHNDLPLWNLPHPNDAQALRNYEEEYEYDAVGNLTAHSHTAVGSAVGSWTRRYRYGDGPFTGSPVPVPVNNRLHSTSLPGDTPSGAYSAAYTHDANGNMVAMPHLAEIAHTHADQMKRADLGGGGTAYYTYDASGERVRKVIQRIGTTREERIYLGGWELYRKRQGASGDLVLERETLHVMDDSRRIAMVETKTVDADVPGTLPIVPRLRYQYSNHLDSAHLECDGTGLVISYEEYHPYGTPAYRSARSGVEVSEKRYRYTGKERDEETGFQYHSARYYAPWLGRWTSADPLGMVDGPCLYAYARNRPSWLNDPTGTDAIRWATDEPTQAEKEAQASIQEEHEPLFAPRWTSLEGEESTDVSPGDPSDPNDLRPWVYLPPATNASDDCYEDINNLLDFYDELNAPPAEVGQSSPPMEPVVANALVLTFMDPILLLLAASGPDQPTVAELRQEIRPFPYQPEELASGEAGEFMFQMAVTFALSAPEAGAARAGALLGSTAAGAEADAMTAGRLGGALFPESRLPYLSRYLERHGIELKVGDQFLPPTAAAGFSAEGRVLLLRSGATRYEVQHELGHFIQWRRLGTTAYDAQSTVQKEQFVYDLLSNNPNRWNALGDTQRNHASGYILRLGGIR